MIKFTLFFAISLSVLSADLLPSWKEGRAKQALLNFVELSTKEEADTFIPVEKRIATFDQDGTLWVEKPIYTQLFFAIDRIKALAHSRPEWENKEPYHSVVKGNLKDLEKLTPQEIEAILTAAFTGISLDDFYKKVNTWLNEAIHPRFRKPYTELVYQPMIEALDLLRNKNFKVYIVSGGGQEFMRAYAERVYKIPPEQIIGTTGKFKFEMKSGVPALIKTPDMLWIDDKAGKPEGIQLVIGRKPVAAFGNSTGDEQMLEWAQASGKPSLQMLVHHDDPEREYAYGEESKIGYFPLVLMNRALKQGWVVISMKEDWKVVFPEHISKEENEL